LILPLLLFKSNKLDDDELTCKTFDSPSSPVLISTSFNSVFFSYLAWNSLADSSKDLAFSINK
jgi:hypothetical protein